MNKKPESLDTVKKKREREREREREYTLVNVIARNCNRFYMPKNMRNLTYIHK